MNLELIKNAVEDAGILDKFEDSRVKRGVILEYIRDSKKELELIKRSLMHGIACVNRTGDDEKLHEAYTDLDAFLNPEIFEPTHSSDPAIDHEKEYTSKYATIEADGEVTYSNE